MEIVYPGIQHYDWANPDPSTNNCRSFVEDDYPNTTPIAEVWYGTHDRGQAFIASTGESLRDYLQGDMPHLFKFLSVGMPLSLQVHPDRNRARAFHDKTPSEFPDPREKSEMVICLSETADVLCGVRPWSEIRNEIVTYFKDVFDSYHIQRLPAAVVKDKDIIAGCIRDLIVNLLEMSTREYDMVWRRLYHRSSLFRKLEMSNAGDRGCAIAALFLNAVRLSRWDSLFIPPNTMHSYLSGELFESMVNSDNVIRIGLTRKYRNYPAFFECARFTPSEPFIHHYSPPPSLLETATIYDYFFPPLPRIRHVRGVGTRTVDGVFGSHHDDDDDDKEMMLSSSSPGVFFFVVLLEGPETGLRINGHLVPLKKMCILRHEHHGHALVEASEYPCLWSLLFIKY